MLLHMIPTSFENSVFGHLGDPGVQYVVPMTFLPPPGTCSTWVRCTKRMEGCLMVDQARWYSPLMFPRFIFVRGKDHR